MRSSSHTSTSLRERCGRFFFEPSCQFMARCVEALFLRCLLGLCAVGDDLCALMTVPCLGLCVRLFGCLVLLLRALLLFHYLCSSSLAVSSRFESLASPCVFFSSTSGLPSSSAVKTSLRLWRLRFGFQPRVLLLAFFLSALADSRLRDHALAMTFAQCLEECASSDQRRPFH